jgi:hypothetical protein
MCEDIKFLYSYCELLFFAEKCDFFCGVRNSALSCINKYFLYGSCDEVVMAGDYDFGFGQECLHFTSNIMIFAEI